MGVVKKVIIFGHFGSVSTSFRVLEDSPKSNIAHQCWSTVGKIYSINPSHFLDFFFYFGEVTMWMWWKMWFLIILDLFWPFFGYLSSQLNQIWPYNSEILFIKSNSTTLAIRLIFFFNFGVTMWVWWKRWFLIILGNFWPLLRYLRHHPNQIWPINTKALLLRSISTTPATFLIIFFILGR